MYIRQGIPDHDTAGCLGLLLSFLFLHASIYTLCKDASVVAGPDKN